MRLSNWQSRLAEYVQSVRVAPFEWGVHDCCIFVCTGVERITGEDYGEFFRGQYHDEASAYKRIEEYCGGGLSELIEKMTLEHGFSETLPLMAQRGDVALCLQGEQHTLGIIDFTGRYVMIAAQHGIMRLPLDCVIKAWRIE